MPAAMLAPLLTLALLPLALAACPCPPAPAAAEVCGSDHKTYPSACDLDCTAPPGVAAAHPGPCRPTNATLLLSATEERQKWDVCTERQCSDLTYSECGEGDWSCRWMCLHHCRCACLGLQTSGQDIGQYHVCLRERDCWGQYTACTGRCSTEEEEECTDRCWKDEAWCYCMCAQQAEGTIPRPANSNPDSTSPAAGLTPSSQWSNLSLLVALMVNVPTG